MRLVEAGALTVGVYNCGGELCAIEDRCSHDDGPLCEGEWEPEACMVVCPRHGSDSTSRAGIADVAAGVRGGGDVSRLRARRRGCGGHGAGCLTSGFARRSRASRWRTRRSARAGLPAARGRGQVAPSTGRLPVRARGVASRHARCWRSAARGATRRSGSPPAHGCSAVALVSLESDPAKCAAWRTNVAEAGLEEWAELVEGDAHETLARTEDVFDLVFLDAEKGDYETLFALARPLLEPGGLVIADNVLSHVDTLAAYSAARGRPTRRSRA